VPGSSPCIMPTRWSLDPAHAVNTKHMLLNDVLLLGPPLPLPFCTPAFPYPPPSHPPSSLHPVQDWLNDESTWVSYLTTNATLGRLWLMQMGKGADKSGISIQYCMSLTRHIMQSLEIPAVVRCIARAHGCCVHPAVG
jgi:hypothetical protein